MTDKELAQALADGLVEQQAVAIDYLNIGRDLWATIDGSVDLVALARRIHPLLAPSNDESAPPS